MFNNWYRIFRLGDLNTVLLVIVFSMITMLFTISLPADQESIEWRTGKDLARGAKIGVSGTWTDTPIRGLLQQLSRQQRIALFVDRRVDPTARVNLAAQNLNWEQLLLKIGEPHGYFFCQIENIYYFGPREVCLTLPAIYEKLRSDLLKRRNELTVNWRVPVSTNWPRLSRPAQLLADLGQEHGIELYSAEDIGHDLWVNFDSPEIPLMLKAVLLTTGFGKTIAVSKTGSKMKVVGYPNVKKCSWVIEHFEDAKAAVRKVQLQHKQTKMKAVSRERIELTGSSQAIYPAITALIEQQASLGGQGPLRFTLELKSSRGSALATLAKQLNVEFEYSDDAYESLSEFVERDFKDALPEDIIRGVLEGTELSYRLDGKKLKIQ